MQVASMPVIGLTGGIGSGKTTVARILKRLGAAVIDADEVGHVLLSSRGEVRQEVVLSFGKDILVGEDVDRQRLAQIVFHDSQARERLNHIMHPRIYSIVEEEIRRLRETKVVVVLEAALLLEAGWEELVDEVWVTYASEDKVVARLSQRDNLSPQDIRARLSSQLSPEEKVRRAQVVVNTDHSLPEVEEEVRGLWRGLNEPR
jgi:dephospho-CoA kinase